MMSAAHGQAVLVRERGEIMRMRSVHNEPNQRTTLLLRNSGSHHHRDRECVVWRPAVGPGED